MTVRQLKQRLKHYPDDLEIYVPERSTDFAYGMIEHVESKEINFMEEPGGEIIGRQKVLVLSED